MEYCVVTHWRISNCCECVLAATRLSLRAFVNITSPWSVAAHHLLLEVNWPRRQHPCGKRCAGRTATAEAYITHLAKRLISLLVICTYIWINVTFLIQDTQSEAREELPTLERLLAKHINANGCASYYKVLAHHRAKYINAYTRSTDFMLYWINSCQSTSF